MTTGQNSVVIIVHDFTMPCFVFVSMATDSKPISSLFGQGSPIFAVRVESPRDRIYSISNDNTVKVGVVQSQCCAHVTSFIAAAVFLAHG